MPLILSYPWNVDVDVIPRFEVEELGSFDHQVRHLSTEGQRPDTDPRDAAAR